MTHHPFSLIIANYNTQEYIAQCLESVLMQDYPRFEAVCIDDGSTDASSAILREFADGNHRMRLIRTENQGLERSCNLGISRAQFDLIVRVDADDFLHRGFLNAMNQAVLKQPEYDFYYCGSYIEYHSESRQIAKTLPAFDPDEIFGRGDFFATGTVYRKTDLELLGGFPTEEKNCGLENYSVVLELLTRGKRGLAVENARFYYRRHAYNMSTVKREAIVRFGEKLLSRYNRKFRTNRYHPYGLVVSEVA